MGTAGAYSGTLLENRHFCFYSSLAAAIFAIIVNTIGPFNAVHVTLILPVSLT